MHAVASASASATSSLVIQRSAEVVLVVGTSNPNMEKPIIGPPEIIFSGCSLNPPAASKSSWKLVPIKNSKLPGSSTASPVTVKILLVTGFPSFTAWYTATMVATLSTIHPASAGSILELIARLVTA